jgi:hypothetical protein
MPRDFSAGSNWNQKILFVSINSTVSPFVLFVGFSFDFSPSPYVCVCDVGLVAWNRRTGPPSKQYRSPGHTVDSFACEKITVVLKKKQKKTITYIPGVNHKTFVWFVWLNSLSSCLDAINSAAVCKSSPCVCVYKSWRSIIKVCVCVKEMLAVVVVVVVHDGWAGQILFLKRNHGDFSYM